MRLATFLGIAFISLATPMAQRARGCSSAPWTARMYARDAQFIIYARITRTTGTAEKGTTDFAIESVLRNHLYLSGKKEITLPRHINIEEGKPRHLILFGEMHNGEADFYAGVPATPAFLEYFRGLLTLDPKTPKDTMSYCWRYLEHAEKNLADDAFNEISMFTDIELIRAARKLAPEKLRAWLKDDETGTRRQQVYALMLAACGDDGDAELLRQTIEKQQKKEAGAPELFAGLILLRPREGWAYTLALGLDDKQPFMVRYATLRAARLLHTSMPDLVPRKDRLVLLRYLVEQPDISDLAIEELRRWKQWDLSGVVLTLWNSKNLTQPIVRRAILHYALQCPNRDAKKFVDDLRQVNPELVKTCEENLKAEASAGGF